MAVRFHTSPVHDETYQSRPIDLGVLSCVTENVTVLHPRGHRTELALVDRCPAEWENVGAVQVFTQGYFFTEHLK